MSKDILRVLRSARNLSRAKRRYAKRDEVGEPNQERRNSNLSSKLAGRKTAMCSSESEFIDVRTES